MTDQSKIQELEQEIRLLKERNLRVEADKAWETSWIRKIFLTLTTYIVASAVLFIIEVDDPFVGACIPAIGYFLSTQTLPPLKKWWLKKFKE